MHAIARRSVLVSVVCAAAGCRTPPAVGVSDPISPAAAAVRPQIDSSMARFNQFMRAGPADSAAAMFTADGELYEPHLAVKKGRTAIRDFLAPLTRQVRLESAVATTQVLQRYGKTVIQWGEYVENASQVTGPEESYRGRFVAEWSLQSNARWLLRRLMLQPLSGW